MHMCKMMISPVIFFHFFKSLIFRVFQISSINTKRKFRGLPHLPHMCIIFSNIMTSLLLSDLNKTVILIKTFYWPNMENSLFGDNNLSQ